MSLSSSRGVTELALELGTVEGGCGGWGEAGHCTCHSGGLLLACLCVYAQADYTQNLSRNCFSMSGSKGSRRSGVDDTLDAAVRKTAS